MQKGTTVYHSQEFRDALMFYLNQDNRVDFIQQF